MFRLGRPNVLPEADLGIRKGVQRAYGLRKLPTPARVREIGATWSPFSSVASWYMWRLLDIPEKPKVKRKGRSAKRKASKQRRA
jgi:3-methyladenine DNA glycosylase/8-oxoguanine DNA glycosylase